MTAGGERGGGRVSPALGIVGTIEVPRETVVVAVWALEAAEDVAGLEALAYVFLDTELEEFVLYALAGAQERRL